MKITGNGSPSSYYEAKWPPYDRFDKYLQQKLGEEEAKTFFDNNGLYTISRQPLPGNDEECIYLETVASLISLREPVVTRWVAQNGLVYAVDIELIPGHEAYVVEVNRTIANPEELLTLEESLENATPFYPSFNDVQAA